MCFLLVFGVVGGFSRAFDSLQKFGPIFRFWEMLTVWGD